MRPLCNMSIVCQHAKLCPPGAVIECGVFEGVTSVHLRQTLGPEFEHYAADTFEGMPYDGSDLEMAGGFFKGYLTPENRAETLQSLQNNNIVPLIGRVEDTLHQVEDVDFTFIYMDLDLEEPTRYATRILLPQLAVGGRIGFHDYLLRKGYCLSGIATVVSEFLLNNDSFKEAFRGGSHRDGRFIFFEKVK